VPVTQFETSMRRLRGLAVRVEDENASSVTSHAAQRGYWRLRQSKRLAEAAGTRLWNLAVKSNRQTDRSTGS